MADDTTPIDITPPEDKPQPQTPAPPPTIAKPPEADINKTINPQVPPGTQYRDPRNDPQAREYQDQINEGQKALQQQMADIEAFQKRQEDLRASVETQTKELQDEIRRVDETRAQPPELLPMDKRPPEDIHAANQVGMNWPNAIATLGILALGIAGKRRGGALNNYFLGSFLQAYAEGQQEKQKNLMTMWLKNSEEIYKENQQRLAEYHAKLSDQSFSLRAKMDLLNNLAKRNEDLPMQKAIQSERLDNIKAQLANYRSALNQYVVERNKTFAAAQQLAGDKKLMGEYHMALNALFQRDHGRWPANDAERDTEMESLPLFDWYQTRIKAGGTDPKTGAVQGFKLKEKSPNLKGDSGASLKSDSAPDIPKTPTAKPTATPAPSATPSLDDSVRDFLGQNMPKQ